MTDSDNEEEGVEDVFGNPVISLSPPDDEQTGTHCYYYYPYTDT